MVNQKISSKARKNIVMTSITEKSDKVTYQETEYGFRYGALTIERCASHNGHVVISLKTPRETVYIRSTPTGLLRTSKIIKVESQ